VKLQLSAQGWSQIASSLWDSTALNFAWIGDGNFFGNDEIHRSLHGGALADLCRSKPYFQFFYFTLVVVEFGWKYFTSLNIPYVFHT